MNYYKTDLDNVGADAERASDPEKHRKSSEQVLCDLHPFWSRSRWSELVRTVRSEVPGCVGTGQPSLEIGVEPLAENVDFNGVNVEYELLLQTVNSFT